MGRRIRARRAAAAVEFVVLLPVLGLLFTVTLDFARAYRASQVLRSAASAAGRYASGTAWVPVSTTTTADAAVAAALAEGASLVPPLDASQVTATVSGGLVTVTVVYDFPLITGFLVPSGTVRMTRTTTCKVAPKPGD